MLLGAQRVIKCTSMFSLGQLVRLNSTIPELALESYGVGKVSRYGKWKVVVRVSNGLVCAGR